MALDEKTRASTQYFTCKAKNAVVGQNKNGTNYIKVGLVVVDGPEANTWINKFCYTSEKALKYTKETLKIMGVKLIDDTTFTFEDRLVDITWGWNDKVGRMDVQTVKRSTKSAADLSAAIMAEPDPF